MLVIEFETWMIPKICTMAIEMFRIRHLGFGDLFPTKSICFYGASLLYF